MLSKVKEKWLHFIPPITQNEGPHWWASLGSEAACSNTRETALVITLRVTSFESSLEYEKRTVVGPGCDVNGPMSRATW